MQKISNYNCREVVRQMLEFNGSNLYARLHMPRPNNPVEPVHSYRYVVYSYGDHWPLFVAEWLAGSEPVWYENEDRYSVTTSKHKSQAHPHRDTIKLNQSDMRRLAMFGIAGVVAGVRL